MDQFIVYIDRFIIGFSSPCLPLYTLQFYSFDLHNNVTLQSSKGDYYHYVPIRTQNRNYRPSLKTANNPIGTVNSTQATLGTLSVIREAVLIVNISW